MIKRIMIAFAAAAVLVLTGCTENREKLVEDNSVSASFEGEKPANPASETENDASDNNSKSPASSVESKPEEKPVESSSTSTIVEKPVESTSTTTEKPVASTTTSKVEKPVASSTTSSAKPVASSSSTTSKVEKPASSSSTTSKPSTPGSSSSTTTSVSSSKPVEKVHNCSTDGHVFEVTTRTTEPKWCREMHYVFDNGYDVTQASRYLKVNEGEAYDIFIDNMEDIGVNGAAGSATINVEVWGTETFETKTCKFCNYSEVQVGKGTITPIGEWHYVNGVNPRITNPKLNFNTLFYDPYNVPQVVIDNINLKWEIIWG